MRPLFPRSVLAIALAAAACAPTPEPASQSVLPGQSAARCTDPAQTGKAIADGPSWPWHGKDFTMGAKPRGNVAWAMPPLDSRDAFAAFATNVIMTAPEHKDLGKGRTAFWHDLTGTMVVVDPAAPECGAMRRPEGGKQAFDSLK